MQSNGVDEDSKKLIEGIEWLKVLLTIALIAFLVMAYIFAPTLPENRIATLIFDNLIPDFIAVLTAIPIIYFFLRRKGISGSSETSIGSEDLPRIIKEALESGIPDSSKVVTFFDSYRSVDWHKILEESQSNIDIVVYYLDSWVSNNYDSLVTFFRKPGTSMRLFVADPEDSTVSLVVERLFPEYSKEIVKSKIERTGNLISQALAESGTDAKKLEIYYVTSFLSYSARCIDNHLLVIGLFEIQRKLKIDSPVIVLDLSKSPHLTEFWYKEVQGLLSTSRRVNINYSKSAKL